MKKFTLIGAAGYIAPRHLKAIKETGNELVAALDTFDSVGIMDSFFPNADFFTEFERYDRHLEKLRFDRGLTIDYTSICTPNYLHDAHIRTALRIGSDAICEKPLVLNPWNIDALSKIEESTGKRIWNILQLRVHPSIIALKKKIDENPSKIHDIDLTYLTSRGHWYYTSWKGDVSKSGGIATNIGVHFFDMLSWIFGEAESNIVHVHSHDRAGGFMRLKNANVRWFLSINDELLPDDVAKKGQRTFRSITVDGEELEFSNGFTDLHTVSYQEILDGNGYGIEATRQAIELVHGIRHANVTGLKGDYHPLSKAPLSKHPFTL
ncbi:Gfo/Idh/MocA family oxidoreductase [uncultured Roseivirga sp.]|uniref:Gfo/Idh/MocA family oxidoreductase n=1 Tax=uncultured Roseivirga sp. TaxID=543088 RepID=UPI002589F100|nr:Gfo/Idh/MocA family oxidoreductase [uncultured Roseivirga sp.]|tara:strand:+ start:4089 stop:5054 length:966 start_codon:yes stop_codon:yes gene_type:complete